jgi:isopentenyl diphosphate isomerase/L-lactate dehydrogenase-like FMN-dependent dehydrogenase
MPNFGFEVALEVYGNQQTRPALPFSFEVWEQRARSILDDKAFGYIAGGAGAGETIRANREAFERRKVWPRMLRDVAERDLQTTLFGTRLQAPLLLAPIGIQSIMHPEAERATARAAVATGVPFILSTVSSVAIEEVAGLMGEAPRWFQLYAGKGREVTASMLHRAEVAGYSAVVVTLDTAVLGWRETDLAHAYLPFLQGEGIANYLSDPAFRGQLQRPPEEDPGSAIQRFLTIFSNPSLTWREIDFIRAQTRLPLLLKGILHPGDAEQALDHGADGVIVSNHGGRQLDGGVAALDALEAVSERIRERVPLLMDSGIRRGADVLKAIALGAKAVLLGRPYAYGLAVGGEVGVRQVIRNLMAEIDLELALSGRRSISEVDRSLLSAH